MKRARSFAVAMSLAASAVAQTTRPDDVAKLLIDRPMMSAMAELSKPPAGEGNALVARIDDRRRLALGVSQTLRAVEKLQAGFAMLGPRRDGIGRYLPMVRLMGQEPAAKDDASPWSVPVTAAMIDAGLVQFRDDLATAIQTLDAVKDPDVNLTLPLLKLRMDVNGLQPEGDKSLGDILKRLNVIDARSEVNNDDLLVRFDAGDVAWLKGYLHLLSAMTEVTLAYDKAELIDTCGELLFRRVAHSPNYPANMTPTYPIFGGVDLVDLIAFVHQLRLPVKEPARFEAARQHLLATVKESRNSWAAILKETDDDREWVPGPKQNSVMPRVAVTQPIVDSWLAFLDEGEAVLNGEKLLPFWRATDGRGINVKFLCEKPPAFDPVLWVQGSALGPYIQKGPPLATGDTYRRLDRLLQGDFFTFAVFVN